MEYNAAIARHQPTRECIALPVGKGLKICPYRRGDSLELGSRNVKRCTLYVFVTLALPQTSCPLGLGAVDPCIAQRLFITGYCEMEVRWKCSVLWLMVSHK